MGILSSLFGNKEKNSDADMVNYRLTWFELQIAPFAYRFAIIPEQPILIGLSGENGEKGATLLIRYDHVPETYEKTVERVTTILETSGIEHLPLRMPESVFSENELKTDSIHLRFAYADGRRWAGFYSLGDTPKEIIDLISKTKSLAKEIQENQTDRTIDGKEAMSHLETEKNQKQKESPEVIVKIRVRSSGKIFLDDREVTFEELETSLNALKKKNGQVWYYRENPGVEPAESMDKVIKKVLDAVVDRKLPIRLQEEEY